MVSNTQLRSSRFHQVGPRRKSGVTSAFTAQIEAGCCMSALLNSSLITLIQPSQPWICSIGTSLRQHEQMFAHKGRFPIQLPTSCHIAKNRLINLWANCNPFTQSDQLAGLIHQCLQQEWCLLVHHAASQPHLKLSDPDLADVEGKTATSAPLSKKDWLHVSFIRHFSYNCTHIAMMVWNFILIITNVKVQCSHRTDISVWWSWRTQRKSKENCSWSASTFFFRPTPSWLPPGRSTCFRACCNWD